MQPTTSTPKAALRSVETGWSHLDQRLSGGLVRGGVHEWLGVGDDGRSLDGWSPPLFLLIHLANQGMLDAGERGEPGYVVWIGRSVWPYPQAMERGARVLASPIGDLEPERPGALVSLGEEGGQDPLFGGLLLGHSLFVAAGATRSGSRAGVRERSERLWAIDTALRCPSVTAVVADGSGLTMAATRRLQLAAASTKNGPPTLALLARPAQEIKELSAATTRWLVAREPREDLAREGPEWRITLTRAKGLQKIQPPEGAQTTKNEAEATGRRRNQPKQPQRALWQLHHHASRPGPPSPLFLHRSIPAPSPESDAPARSSEDLLSLPDPH